MSNPLHDHRRPQPLIAGLFGVILVALAGAVLLGFGSVVGAPPATPEPAAAANTPSAAVTPGSSGAASPLAIPVSPSAVPSLSSPPAETPTPAPLPTPTPAPTPTPLDPPAAPGPFAMDLYRKGGFVTELTKVMCVPAAMQTMINVMDHTTDTTSATQQRLYSLARKLSPKTLKGPGAEPEGWAAALAKLGYGSFKVTIFPTMKAAIQAAAKAVRMTGRPAGLLVWYGAHSWVMSGFRATADPAYTSRFTVSDVYIEDVWYPKISTIWGASRPPDALVPVQKLPRDFLPWRMPGGPYPDKVWKFVTVLPVAAPH